MSIVSKDKANGSYTTVQEDVYVKGKGEKLQGSRIRETRPYPGLTMGWVIPRSTLLFLIREFQKSKTSQKLLLS